MTKISKAITSAIAAGIGVYLAATQLEEPARIGAALGAAIAAGFAVWLVPNAPATPKTGNP